MGMTRKLMSITTAGLVDFRSDKERTARKTAKGARYSKQAAKQAQMQTELMRQQLAAQQQVQPAPTATPATMAERLAHLDQLHATGAISDTEHAQQRAAILSAI